MKAEGKLRARLCGLALLGVAALLGGAAFVHAHAILKSSIPASGSTVTGPDIAVTLTFNVRVDVARSKLQLLMPDTTTVDLPEGKQPSPDTLVSQIKGIMPGAYTIRWQVLAPDGHISRGEIPFKVKGN